MLKAVHLTAGAAFCVSLVSCMVPYDGDSRLSTTYTAYQTGYRVNTLPGGYRSETISGNTYYYDNGNYYRRDTDGYVVIEAPRNSRYYTEYGNIRRGGQSNSYQNQQVYDRNNSRSQRVEVIPRLPSGHRVVSHRGQQYYQVSDRYYIQDQGQYRLVRSPY